MRERVVMEKERNRGTKDLLGNIGLAVGSTCFILLLFELAFPHVMHKVPLGLYGIVHEGIRTLVQTSKGSTVPEDYVAIAGDSYALGAGDWFHEQRRTNWYGTPDYHSAHLLHTSTGRDVVSYAGAGAGSLRSLVAEPITQFSYINDLWAFSLETPQTILVYFYEGNDLSDNIKDLEIRFQGRYDMDRVYDPVYFRGFLEEMVLAVDPLYQAVSFFDNLVFCKFFFKGIRGLGYEVKVFWENRKKKKSLQERVAGASEHVNEAIIGGKRSPIPDWLQAPALELTVDEIRLAIYVFEQALLYLAAFFENTAVNVVYIPSPLACYRLSSPRVSIQTYLERAEVYDSDLVSERSDAICSKIGEIARTHDFGFLDTREILRRASVEKNIHGPHDWKHFNKEGYHIFSKAIAAAFFEEKGSRKNNPPNPPIRSSCTP